MRLLATVMIMVTVKFMVMITAVVIIIGHSPGLFAAFAIRSFLSKSGASPDFCAFDVGLGGFREGAFDFEVCIGAWDRPQPFGPFYIALTPSRNEAGLVLNTLFEV